MPVTVNVLFIPLFAALIVAFALPPIPGAAEPEPNPPAPPAVVEMTVRLPLGGFKLREPGVLVVRFEFALPPAPPGPFVAVLLPPAPPCETMDSVVLEIFVSLVVMLAMPPLPAIEVFPVVEDVPAGPGRPALPPAPPVAVRLEVPSAGEKSCSDGGVSRRWLLLARRCLSVGRRWWVRRIRRCLLCRR